MVEYRIPGAEFLSTAVVVISFLIAVIAITRRAERGARTVGVGGVVALSAGLVLDAVNSSLGSVYGTRTPGYVVATVVVGVLGAGGLVLLALAVVWCRRAPKPRGDRR